MTNLDATDAELAVAGLGVSAARLEILRFILSKREVSVTAIMVEVGMTRNGVRRHLEALQHSGLISERRTTHPRGSGPITYFSANEDSVAEACGVDRSVAAFCDRFVSLVADDEDAGCGFDDVVGDRIQLVDLEHAVDLGEEPFEETEVAAGDAFDGGDGLCVGEVVGVEGLAESFPVAVEDKQEFFAPECPVVM
ncbi:ArsR family transcriptional regulator [Subtercola vilae]|uniref:ArsR family transcriptional regulator n=1 Tax=Subtercola vilae TaxID=2056433 RepID=A0A4T2BWG2_9MICO|nr:ArsR family transcriptional regulator [Subtercola vilae]